MDNMEIIMNINMDTITINMDIHMIMTLTCCTSNLNENYHLTFSLASAPAHSQIFSISSATIAIGVDITINNMHITMDIKKDILDIMHINCMEIIISNLLSYQNHLL